MGPTGIPEIMILLFFSPFIIAGVLAFYFSRRSRRGRDSN
jgi:hypothetical protein